VIQTVAAFGGSDLSHLIATDGEDSQFLSRADIERLNVAAMATAVVD
jgi:hypothetical protein